MVASVVCGHSNILLEFHCLSSIFCFVAMTSIAYGGMVVTFPRSNWHPADSTIIGPSISGDQDIHVKYLQNGNEIEHAKNTKLKSIPQPLLKAALNPPSKETAPDSN